MASKAAKELFVAGLEGTTPWELVLIASSAVIGALNLFYFHEIFSFLIPMMLCQTSYLYPYGVAYQVLLSTISGVAFLLKKNTTATTTTSDPATTTIIKRNAVTVYRSSLMIFTCIAILAVDFDVFPRRFAKTELHGYSWMDLGAASFVVSAGMVHARQKETPLSDTSDWRRALPLFGMGLVRLLTHKGIDYQENASEYGIHWNFYFTLGVLTLTTNQWSASNVLWPILWLVLYQLLLSNAGLQTWVQDAPRTCDNRAGMVCELVIANREGILGCVGYGALFGISQWTAKKFFWKTQQRLWRVIAVFGVSWYILVSIIGIPVSRRTTNLSFCAWVLLVNYLQLAGIHAVLQMTRSKIPRILTAINRQGLLVFVIANLLTGLVNLTIDTLEASDTVALAILCMYMALLVSIACKLDSINKRNS